MADLAYDGMREDLTTGQCVVINEKDEVFFCTHHIGTIGKDFSEKAVFWRISLEMRKQQYWPNIYRVNDHGNVSLLNGRGKEIRAWV